MRQFAWYSPELDVIMLQSIMEDCYIMFEWDGGDLHHVQQGYDIIEPSDHFLWMPLGEV